MAGRRLRRVPARMAFRTSGLTTSSTGRGRICGTARRRRSVRSGAIVDAERRAAAHAARLVVLLQAERDGAAPLPQPEPRARYRAMLGVGYTDAFRSLHLGEIGHFTFWDYFRQAFHNRGIRIDHFLLSPKLANRLEACEIDKEPRAQEKPSDHTPIIVTLSNLP